MTANELRSINPGVVLVHVAGNVDRAELEAVGVLVRPSRFARPGHMSVATDYLGPRPLTDLHSAGLKVGELAAKARQQGLAANKALAHVLNASDLAQSV